MPLIPLAGLETIVPLFRGLHAFHARELSQRYHTHGSDADYLDFVRGRVDTGSWVFARAGSWGPEGYLLASPTVTSGDFLSHPRRYVTLEHLYVVPHARGAGIGAALITEMEQKMRAENHDVWMVGFNAFNTEAERFYAGQGAQPHGGFRSKRISISAPAE